MPEQSPAYIIAKHIHTTFFGKNYVLTATERKTSGVTAGIGSTNSATVERLETTGVIDGHPAAQTLSRDNFGTFHLSTNYIESNPQQLGIPMPAHMQLDVRPDSSLDSLEILTKTFFMKALVDIANNRHFENSG